MNNKGLYIGAVLLLIIGIIAGWNIKKKFSHEPDRIVIVDTAIQTVVKYELKKDTVIKWHERLVYHNVTPLVRVDKADTVFLKEIQFMDLMLKVKKENDILTVYAVNEQDSVVREYVFQNVSDDFTATSMTGDIFVKTKHIDWNGLTLYGTAEKDLKGLSGAKLKNLEYETGLMTGVKFFNRLNLHAGIGYNFDIKDFKLKTGLSINLIK